MSLREKHIELIRKTMQANRATRTLLSLVGASFFFCVVGLFIFLALKVDKILGWPRFSGGLVATVVAWLVLAAGASLCLWSVLHFLKARGTPVPLNPPPRLVTTGPYAYVRNPMLSGLFIVLFGLGLVLGSLGLVCIFTPLFIVLNVWQIRALEEPELQKRLGDEYRQYQKKVGRFLPRLK